MEPEYCAFLFVRKIYDYWGNVIAGQQKTGIDSLDGIGIVTAKAEKWAKENGYDLTNFLDYHLDYQPIGKTFFILYDIEMPDWAKKIVQDNGKHVLFMSREHFSEAFPGVTPASLPTK